MLTPNQEIRKALVDTNWSRNTITTLLGRLVSKKALGTEGTTSRYVYFPLVSRDECSLQKTKSLIDKIYSGSLSLLVNNFFRNRSLTEDEASELVRVLENYRKEDSL